MIYDQAGSKPGIRKEPITEFRRDPQEIGIVVVAKWAVRHVILSVSS
jgi:hypothetical protein